ncbi:MAG: M36 family metallopeptidase, partial [Saprospiraceae bacterium]
MNRYSFKQLWLSGMALCLAVNMLSAQETSRPSEIALRYLRTHAAAFNLSPQDVSELRVSNEYLTKHNGLTHVWIQQMYQGNPVNNGLIGLHVRPNGEVLHLGHRFEPNLARRVNTTLPSLSAAKALDMAKLHLGFEGFATPAVREKINERNWVFEAGAISRKPIPVSATYFVDAQHLVRLAWKVGIDQANTPDVWSLFVDAQTGEILDKYNHTVYCNAGNLHAANELCADEQFEAPNAPAVAPANGASGSYRVFALPVESPAHGTQTLVTDPHDLTASPFGWHDTDAAPGAEYTIPRGNNVFAYEDKDNNDTPPNTPGPDGGAALVFDYPYEADQEPIVNQEAAIVNLFYMNNMMHDITYRFGFDEKAGNFQENNYGRGGLGGDYVEAEAQDGGGVDNA